MEMWKNEWLFEISTIIPIFQFSIYSDIRKMELVRTTYNIDLVPTPCSYPFFSLALDKGELKTWSRWIKNLQLY